jgi:sulfotransferase
MPLLALLFPRSRVICCVREVGWILDSIERLRAKNPLHLSKMFTTQSSPSVYTRAEALMHAEKGLVGVAWSTLREAWFADEAKRLIVIPYESLVRKPKQTVKRLYEELGERPFEHDFEHVQYEEPDYDARLGMPGLHTVRPVVRYEERAPRIPPDLFTKYANSNFWVHKELNSRGVTVL